MSKPLSQEEIDVLLGDAEAEEQDKSTGAAVGEQEAQAERERQAQPYNFKRPRLFSQTQKRVLNQVHESFARDLSVYLSAQLRTIVDISLTAVDQVLYSEFVMSSAPPSALYVLREDELEYRSIFEIDPRLVAYTIEKLMGGDGKLMDESREVSPIEQRIMSRVMRRAYRKLEESWEKAYELSVEEVAFESNAEFVQIIPAAEPAFVANYKVSVYEETASINICYPYILLESMLATSDMKQWLSSAISEAPPEVRERYERKIEATEVELRAELGRARVPLPELLRLEAGDVIPLQRRLKDPVSVYVNGREKFTGEAGKSGSYRAVKITDVMDQIETEK